MQVPSQVEEAAADRSALLELDYWPADKVVLAGGKELDRIVIGPAPAQVLGLAAPVLVADRLVR